MLSHKIVDIWAKFKGEQTPRFNRYTVTFQYRWARAFGLGIRGLSRVHTELPHTVLRRFPIPWRCYVALKMPFGRKWVERRSHSVCFPLNRLGNNPARTAEVWKIDQYNAHMTCVSLIPSSHFGIKHPSAKVNAPPILWQAHMDLAFKKQALSNDLHC